MPSDKLRDAIARIKSGDKETAKRLLSEYIRENPSSEAAWLWLSVCVSSVDQKRYCLNRALSINPHNENARKALKRLDASSPPPMPSLAEISGDQPNQTTSRASQSATATATSGLKTPNIPERNIGKYVMSVLLPNEKVLAVARIHWIIFVMPAIFMVLAILYTIIFSFGAPTTSPNASGDTTVVVSPCCNPFWLVGVLGLVLAFMRHQTTEFALTDKRVIGKYGIIRRNSLELVLDKIESISVHQNIAGRIFGYGTLVVTGSGGTRQVFPYIAKPMSMKRAINSVLAE